MGYCRAVVADRSIYVSGTAPIMFDGTDPPDGAYEQTQRCLEVILDALEQAGASADDVVRTRVYITDAEWFDDVARAHAETFRDVRPANTTVVTQLMDPRWKVEVEVEAVLS
jgi:enamine deaminase RidA (YjgF/YER057c/UK114 family)